MPRKNRKSVEPVSLSAAPQHFHRRDWNDYIIEVEEKWIDEGTNPYLIEAKRIGNTPYSIHIFEHLAYLREPYIKDLKEAAVDIANHKSEEAFWDDVKNGKLVLVGYRDPGDGRLWQIPKFVLKDPSAFENWRKERVSGCGLYFVNVGGLKSSEAKTVPEFCGAKEEQPERPEPPKASKGKRGPKPKWDWDAATRELVTLAEKSGGLPWPKAKIVKHLADWFSETYNDIPADSLLRDRVTEWLPIDYHDRK